MYDSYNLSEWSNVKIFPHTGIPLLSRSTVLLNLIILMQIMFFWGVQMT